MAFALALISSVCYGAADFFGGWAARRSALLAVLFWMQLLGLLGGSVLLAVHHPAHVHGADLAKGLGAGTAGVVGAGLFYAGVQRGAVGVVAPLSAVGAALVPLGWALGHGEHPGALPLSGAALAVVAILVIAREPRSPLATGRRLAEGALLGGAAGLGWGTGLVFYSETSDGAGLVPLVGSRAAGVALVAVALLVRRQRPVPPDLPWVQVGAGAGNDVAASALQISAFHTGLTSIVAPVTALYPAFTMVLARLVFREQIGRLRFAGLGVALAGLVLLGLR